MLLTFYKKLDSIPNNTGVQISIEDLYNMNEQTLLARTPEIEYNAEILYNGKTITVETERPPRNFNQTVIDSVLDSMLIIAESINLENIQNEYVEFFIPKRSGGLRKIDAPKDNLKQLHRDLKIIFESSLRVLYHDAAYAYVKNRSTIKALKVHQDNNSRWFLKLDIKDFFPSCNLEFIVTQLQKLYPFNYMDKDKLTTLISYCMLNGGLPQGTPMSPMLTNLIMLPIDHRIQEYCIEKGFTYTRYADDILISTRESFNWQTVQTVVKNIFISQNAPFTIKEEKTRYGSSAGRNWNLGLMLNKDNQITIGNEKKKRLKVMLNNFLKDYYSGNKWSLDDTYKLQGIISYYKNIEPNYIKDLITKYEDDFQVRNNSVKSFKDICKEIIKGNVQVLNQAIATGGTVELTMQQFVTGRYNPDLTIEHDFTDELPF